MEIFFKWRDSEKEKLIFIGAALIALTLSICLGMLIFIITDVDGLRSVVAGVSILLTAAILLRKDLRATIIWSLLLMVAIELIVGLYSGIIELWLGMLAFDLGVLYLIMRSNLL